MKKRRIELGIGLLLLAVFIIAVVNDSVNEMSHSIIGFDEGYNASVAANLLRSGRYEVSYPGNIIFYNLITTGETVLLPTALLFKIWGITNLTASVVSLVYGILEIAAIFILFSHCLGRNKFSFIISELATVLVILTDPFFADISTRLIGETAATFFCVLSILFLSLYARNDKCKMTGNHRDNLAGSHRDNLSGNNKGSLAMFGVGFMLAFAFLTKSSVIFFMVSMLGLILLEVIITRRISIKDACHTLLGFSAGFILLDSYKLFQLGGVISYLKWWYAEFRNMLTQSGGADASCTIVERFRYLEEIFGVNPYVSVGMILLPIVLYLLYLYYIIRHKRRIFTDSFWVMTLAGVGAASLEVFFLIMGQSGLVYGRRHGINEILLKCCVIYYLLAFVYTIYKRMTHGEMTRVKSLCGLLGAGIVFLAICPGATLGNNWNWYTSKLEGDSYENVLMQEFLEDVNHLDSDASLYCLGWWQDPNISIFLDRRMTNIQAVPSQELDRENGYLIIGRRFDGESVSKVSDEYGITLTRVNDIQVDYNALDSYGSEELYSIYKVE